MSGSNENDKQPFIDPFAPQLGARRKKDDAFNPDRAVLADKDGFDPNRATEVKKTWGERLKDTGMALGNSGVAGGEAIVGLGNILTNGHAGKALENAGVDLKGAHDFYNERKSLDTKVQTQRRTDTESVMGKVGVLMDNPTQIFDTTVESVAPMLVGAAIGRGVKVASPGTSAVTAGAIGEGAAMAGSQAEQIRQQNDSGLLENHQYDNILTTGALGAAIGLAGGQVAKRLGLEDVDTAIAQGGLSSTGTNSLLGVGNKVVLGALTEGFVEELPQTVVETILQNDALGKPWHEGLTDAAVMGVAAGAAMGGGTNAYSAGSQYLANRNSQAPQAPQGSQGPQGPQGPQGSPNLPAPVQTAQTNPNLPASFQNTQSVQSTPILNPNPSTPITNAAIVGANAGTNPLPAVATPQNPVPVAGPLSQAANLALGIQEAQTSLAAEHAQEFLAAEQSEAVPTAAQLYGNTIDGFATEVTEPQNLLGFNNEAQTSVEQGDSQAPTNYRDPNTPDMENPSSEIQTSWDLGREGADTSVQQPVDRDGQVADVQNEPQAELQNEPQAELQNEPQAELQNEPQAPVQDKTAPVQAPVQAKISDLEQQLATEKSVPKKAQIRKQIAELQNGLADQSQREVSLDQPRKATAENLSGEFKRMEQSTARVNAARQRMREANPEIFTAENDRVRETHGLTNARVTSIANEIETSGNYELSDREYEKVKNNPNYKIDYDARNFMGKVTAVKDPHSGEWVGNNEQTDLNDAAVPVQDDAHFQSKLDQLDKQRAQFEAAGDYANAEKVYDEMQTVAREWQTNSSTATPTTKRAEPSKGEADKAWGDFYRKNRNMMSEELFAGGHQDRNTLEEAAPEIQSRHAHGMAKATPAAAVRDLKDILENDIDQNRGQGRLFTAALSQGKITAEQRSAMSQSGTASGSAYSDGAFTLIAKDGVGDIRSVSEIDAVMVNSAVPQEIVNGLRQDFPNMKFGYAKELPSLLSGSKQSNNSQSKDFTPEKIMSDIASAADIVDLKGLKTDIEMRKGLTVPQRNQARKRYEERLKELQGQPVKLNEREVAKALKDAEQRISRVNDPKVREGMKELVLKEARKNKEIVARKDDIEAAIKKRYESAPWADDVRIDYKPIKGSLSFAVRKRKHFDNEAFGEDNPLAASQYLSGNMRQVDLENDLEGTIARMLDEKLGITEYDAKGNLVADSRKGQEAKTIAQKVNEGAVKEEELAALREQIKAERKALDEAEEKAKIAEEKAKAKQGASYNPDPSAFENQTAPKRRKIVNEIFKDVYTELKAGLKDTGIRVDFTAKGGRIDFIKTGEGKYAASVHPSIEGGKVQVNFHSTDNPSAVWSEVSFSEMNTEGSLRAAIFNPLVKLDYVFEKHFDLATQDAKTNGEIASVADDVNTAPSEAQIESGNYKKAHVNVAGLEITIENPKGSTRSGTDTNGKAWSHTMSNHYGYIKKTEGADGEHIDVYVGDKTSSGKVYVVDQINQADGKFDEHKVMLGYSNKPQAIKAYKSNFDKGWHTGNVTEMTVAQFKTWLKNADTTVPMAIQHQKIVEVAAKKTKKSNSDNLTRDQYKAIHEKLISEIESAIKVAPKSGLTIPEIHVENTRNGIVERSKITYVGAPKTLSIGSAEDVLNNLPKGYQRSTLSSENDANIAKVERALEEYKSANGDKPLRITFKTANGTTYDVTNTKESLEKFLKKAKSNPGFKPVVQRRESNTIPFAKISGLKAMIQDTDDRYAEFNAYHYAKAAEIPMAFYRDTRNQVGVKFITSGAGVFEGNNLYISIMNKSSKDLTYQITDDYGNNLQTNASEASLKTTWGERLKNLDKPSHAGSKETVRDVYKRAYAKMAQNSEAQDVLQQTYEDQLNERFNADGKLYSYAGMYSQTRNVGTLSAAADMLHEGASAETIRKETGWFKGVDGLWRYEINDSAAKLKVEGATFQDMLDALFEVSGEPNFTIGDILDHPKLFEAYPHLKDISLDYKGGLGAGYNHATRTVSIGSGVDASKIKSYLLHELQHAIQNLEGFSRGATPSSFGRSAEENFSRYERVAGEVEARDVESRMDMTDNERTATQPYASQGISDEDMIVVFNRKKSVQNTAKEVREKLVERFGEDVISALEKQGKLKIVDDIQGVDSRVEGFYEGGRVTLVASNLSSDQIIPTFLHELGGHAGFQGMMSDKQYQNLMDQFDRLVAEGDTMALRAKQLAERELDPETQRLEMLPYLLTLAAQQSSTTNQKGVLGLISKLVSNVKAWAFDKLGVNLKLNPQDFVALADRMIVKAANPNTQLRSPSNQRLHSMQSFTQTITDSIGAYMKDTPGHLSWWHKTLGSMYNLSERKPAFKPVFLRVQKFIDDLSYFSAVAAEKAPTLLPRIDGLRDMLKTAITKNDNDAIGNAIFEGTLFWGRDSNGNLYDTRLPAHAKKESGTVFTDDELRSNFNLTDAQIGLYREFRAATENSLDNLAKTEMLRMAGKLGRPATDSVLAQDKLSDAYNELERHLYQEISHIAGSAQMIPVTTKVNGVTTTNLQMDPKAVARMAEIQSTIHDVKDIYKRTTNLKVKGYAPLMRFGKYSIAVYDGNELDHFGMYETRMEAEAAYQSLKRVYQANPNARVERGTMSEQDFTQTMGVSMETAALFGEMLKLNQTGGSAADVAFQEYLRKSRSQRSALKRMIHRKGIDGYSVDVTRVLASFVLSNSRRISSNLNVPQINENIQAIPKTEGQLRDAAIELKDFVVNPQEKGSWLRSVMFAQYLGGSVSSAIVNLTQTFAVTMPWLTQHTNVVNANAQIVKARAELIGAALGRHTPNFSANLQVAIKRAEEDGKLSPQEIFQLMEQAQGNQGLRSKDGSVAGDLYAMGANSMVRFSVLWGRMFGLAEQINRRVTFIASYRIAEQEGMPNPEEFARKAVDETQFVLSKASKMKWGRGNTGALLLTFKSYMVFYLELASRMWNEGQPGSPERFRGRRAVIFMAGALILMGGVGGLPFVEDLDDAIDGLGQLMGYNFSTQQKRKEFLETLPLGGFLEKGVSEYMPLDVSNRLGMGNLIPGTSLLTKKEDYSRDMMEIGGPAADFVSRIFRGSRMVLEGDVGKGVLEPMPLAIRNAFKGLEMGTTGEYRNTKGEKVIDVDTGDALLKSIGFQPSDVATVQGSNFQMQKEKSFYNMKVQEIRKEWARAVYDKDSDAIAAARQKMLDWNEKNPNQPIRADMRAIMKRVRDMRKTKAEKIADSAPKALRQRMRQDVNALYDEVGYDDTL